LQERTALPGLESFAGYAGGPLSWRMDLMWGSVILAVVLGLLAAAYFLIKTFVVNRQEPSHYEDV
jgi:hypothetical protein